MTLIDTPTPPSTVRRLGVVLIGLLLALTTTVGLAGPAAAVTHTEAASTFRANGITWSSSGGCSNRYNSTCTSFDGLRTATMQGAVTLKRASGCAINITGGTEVGHASGTYSHFNGYKLDYSPYSCISGYIKRNFRYSGERGDGPIYTAASGNVYVLENGSHWDVTYYNCGGC